MEKNIRKLEKIRSLIILERILSLLKLNKKFDVIRYNRHLQNKLKINIEDFKSVSGRYIKGLNENGNGRGKEYKLGTSIILFEGEYINWKKHGKGKEYYDIEFDEYYNYYNRNNDNNYGQLKFNGEYIKGKKINGKAYNKKGYEILILNNGKGKEYFENRNLQFEGDYINGIRWNGQGYNINGEKEFQIHNGTGNVKE